MKILNITSVAAITAILTAASAAAATPPALYTAAQATAGAAVFAQNCAMCHGADLKGGAGPALLGQSFASTSNNYTVGAIFSEIAEQMPAGQPGSLSHDQYDDAMAYILSKNGYPAGSAALNYDASLASSVPLISQVK
ncbi:MAG TPA: cytochrome c [Acidocella sp.]|nr:MAG: cytochrome C oxidase Cbb3 [Acidocella sp. 20-61-6]HQT47072.1 cytochrome c [Acidocella sp.]